MSSTKDLAKDLDKKQGVIIDPALCRCCRSIKKCRILNKEYFWMDQKEVYSEMFMDCFGLLLSHLDGEYKDCGICATCVVRLRDACAFRQQVLQCEDVFLNAKIENNKDDEEHKMLVEIKTEPICSDTDTYGVPMDTLDCPQDDDNIIEQYELTCEDITVKKRKRKENEITKTRMNTKRTRQKVNAVPKQQLLSKMEKLKVKMDKMLHKKTVESENNIKSSSKLKTKKKHLLDHNNMIYENTVMIVKNSYVCPFLNRISFYYCYYCKDQFTNPQELRDHTLSHDPRVLFEEVMENKKIPKIDITRIDCRLCSDQISDLETFKTHIASVHGKIMHPVENEFLKFRLTMDNLSCTECNSTFPYFDMLIKHMIDHFGTYVCDMCGACFLEQNSLRTHIRSHNKVESNFPCEVCGKNLKSKYSKYLHIATVHEKKPTINCYKCDASFLSYALRNRHLIEVHEDKRTFPCKLCDKVYNRRKTLMEHNRRNHLKIYRHQCDLCDQRFYLPSRLKEHMATHTGERNFRCEFCDKSYPRLQSLQEHIRSHSNDRRFKCDICNSTFTQNGSLKNHMKSHHQGYDMDITY